MTRRYFTTAELDAMTDGEIEDLAIAERIRERLANDNGVRYTMEEVAASLGIDLDELRAENDAELEAAKAQLRIDLGLVPVAPAAVGEFVDVVDDDDNVIGTKLRCELDDTTDRWRIISVWVTNLAGDQVLLARRASTKTHDPGLWAPAVAGTVASGDSDEETAVRETFEELGLEIIASDLVCVGKVVADQDGSLRVATSYLHRTGEDIVSNDNWDREEIDALAWFDRVKLAALVAEHPQLFVGGTNRAWQALLAA